MKPFSHFVRIERPDKVSDGQGGFAVTWVLHVEDHAYIERARSFRSDGEAIRAGGVASTPPVRIHMRSYDLTKTIAPTMRAHDVDGGAYFNIAFVQDIGGDGKTITLTATENLPT